MNKKFFNLPTLPVFFFDADGAPAGGGDTKKDDANAGGDKGGLKQEDLDRQFAERAKRAADTERKKLLDAMGVKDEDELKAIVEAKKKTDDAARTELEKQADRASKAEKALAELKDKTEAEKAQYAKRLLDSEIKLIASNPVTDKDGKVKRAAVRPEAVDALLLMLEREGITEKDGRYEGIESALEKLAKAHGYLFMETSPQDKSKGTPKPEKQFKTSGSDDNKESREPMFHSL